MDTLRVAFGGLQSITSGLGLKNWAAKKGHTDAIPHLHRLPLELILMIAELLPTSSGVCLALCNRRLYHTLGAHTFKSLKSDHASDALLVLLSLLEKDLPKHFACRPCVRLHRISTIWWPRTVPWNFERFPRCTRDAENYEQQYDFSYTVYYPHVRLAMKQHYCGTDIGFPLEAFQHLEVKHEEGKRHTILLSVDAQIVHNELLLRSQTWVSYPWYQRHKFIKELAGYDHPFYTCICMRRRIDTNFLPNLVKSRFSQLDSARRNKSSTSSEETLKCPHCCLDYVLDIKDLGARGFAMVATTWANLGAGVGHEDAKWQNHCGIYEAEDLHQPHVLGEIRADYEGQAEVSLEELTAQNEVKLFSKREKKVNHRGTDGFLWRWDGVSRWYLAPSGQAERPCYIFIPIILSVIFVIALICFLVLSFWDLKRKLDYRRRSAAGRAACRCPGGLA